MEFKRKSKINVAIPTASMPDIIFMLLIFFMVATVIRQYSGLKVQLPAAEKIQKIPGSKRHVVTIWADRNNKVVCDDIRLKKLSDLRQVVYQKLVMDPQIQIALKIDKSDDMGFVNDIHQELRKANALKVHYMSVPGGEF
ncbi:MAG TPA: biopolymer transporter ExbD [Caldithrix abyssi]|uniref:Biopolymer transporter ExbD n=1 Tax=Caldithrix abyssi TaxID=187145 RepID=A0A7V5PPM9_CALAY|nr:biopolymer transporter ExbD [Caldithrix abyssi]